METLIKLLKTLNYNLRTLEYRKNGTEISFMRGGRLVIINLLSDNSFEIRINSPRGDRFKTVAANDHKVAVALANFYC